MFLEDAPRSRSGVAASLGLCLNASPGSPGSASSSTPPGIEPASSESPASASSTLLPRVGSDVEADAIDRAPYSPREPYRRARRRSRRTPRRRLRRSRTARRVNRTRRRARRPSARRTPAMERSSGTRRARRVPAIRLGGAATSDLSRPPRTASVPVASTATASTPPVTRPRPTACGAPSPRSSAQLCLDTAASSFEITMDLPSGVNAKARTLDLPPVRTSLGGTSAGDRSFNVSTSNVRTVSPLGPIVARSLPRAKSPRGLGRWATRWPGT